MAGQIPALSDTQPIKLVRAIRDLFAGRSNAVGEVTLTANASTTDVTAANCGAGSKPVLFPKTANAAAEIGNGTIHISSVGQGTFTLTHANNAQTDRTYHWVALG